MRGVTSRLALLLTLLSTMLDSTSSYKSRLVPVKPAEFADNNVGGYCELFPSCTCVNSMNFSYVYCPGKAFISMYRISLLKIVKLKCYPQTDLDPFKYLSILEFEPDYKHRHLLFVEDCPEPIFSYSSYFRPKDEKNHSLEYSPLPITSLNIEHDSRGNFSLESRHFDGLTFLDKLSIKCTTLEKLPNDLLYTLANRLKELEITDTLLESIPTNFLSKFRRLKRVKFVNNKLKNLPDDIFIVNAQEENLNPMTTLRDDSDIGGLPTNEIITSLDMSGNRLEKLPKSLCSLVKLSYLLVNDNLLEHIEPEFFARLRSLKYFYIKGNRIQKLESHLMIGLQYINESQSSNSNNSRYSKEITSISKLSNEFFNANSDLHEVDMSKNNLKTIPENIFFTKMYLKTLNINSNLLINLPPRLLENNANLLHLHLSNNSLIELYETFLLGTTRLEHINLSKNRIRHLGNNFFSRVKNLRHLDLSDNSIEVVPEELFSPFNESTTFTYLNLEGNGLKSLPRLTIPSLTYLNLAQNNLSIINTEIFHLLNRLEYLNLSYNHLQLIDNLDFILLHKSIQSLDLSHNRLNIPIDVGNNTLSLKSLNISNNVANIFSTHVHYGDLNPISTGVIFLNTLEYLDMSKNRISLIEIEKHGFYEIESKYRFSLKYLDMSHNKINLNNSIVEYSITMKTWGYRSQLYLLKSLEVLIMHHNEITVTPMDWRHDLPNLRLLDLRYNKIKYLGHHDLLFANGIMSRDFDTYGYPQKYYIMKKGKEMYYQFSNAHYLTVDLRHNLIEGMELPYDQIRNVSQGCHVDEEFGHATILLGHNPLVCGCNAFKLLRYALKVLRPVAELERTEGSRFLMPAVIDIDGLTCWEPLSVRGKNLSDPQTWIHHILPEYGLCQFNFNLERDFQSYFKDELTNPGLE